MEPPRSSIPFARDLSRLTSPDILRPAVRDLVALITIRSLSPEEGARALVLGTTTTPAENGKFVTAYISDADYAEYDIPLED